MAKRQYEFGPFQMDTTGPLLFREGHLIPLAPKVADILLVLLENCGTIVKKEEMLKRVWPDTFVEEGSLARTISVLRRTLGHGPEGQEYIATVPKRGYRFVGHVKEVTNATAATAPAKVTLAVLPFQDLSGDKEQEYFADGLTEEMTTQLARLDPEQLRVIARTSAMTYKGTPKSVAEIGRELGVNYILSGSVRRWSDRVRISAQLILACEQTNLWARTYEDRVADILKLQNEIASAIAREVDVRLRPSNLKRLTRNRSLSSEAHECYLKGRYCWNKRTEESLQKALEYFQQAVQHDSTYADGYLGLADSFNILGYYNVLPPQEAFPKAKTAAIRALQLDDSLGEAHAALGVVKRDFEWDWPGAENEFKRALELNAGYAESHHWYATLLNMIGRSGPALNAVLAALELDPVSLAINTDLGRTFYFARQYDQAVKQFKKTMEFDATFGIAYLWLGQVYEQQGLVDQAISHLERGTSISGGNAYALGQLGRGYARAGRKSDALDILRQLHELSQRRYVSPYDIAMVHLGLGDHAGAFAGLNQAAAERCHWLGYLRVEPQMDALRDDPRFADLLLRLGFPVR